MINDYNKLYYEQHWLVAHNAWNTNQSPWNNQCKTIAELLTYGVRGLALDIYGDDEGSLHLQHGHGNPASAIRWSIIRDEIKDWLAANPREIVSLFFESYLTGPRPGDKSQSALAGLDNSLKEIPGYQSGTFTQMAAILNQKLSVLADGNGGTINSTPHRLFAFIERQPDEGWQTIFPTMKDYVAENIYGDNSLRKNSWVNVREGSVTGNHISFMNHFGDAPTGDEYDRNKPQLIKEHADDFYHAFGNHYPTFISLDKINWDDHHAGPLPVLSMFNTPPTP